MTASVDHSFSSRPSSLILFRTDYFDAEADHRLSQLAAESAMPVAVLIDESRDVADTFGHAKIRLDARELGAMGLFTPHDFAWRCGDYGLYLAMKRYPAIEQFWLVEHDVRIAASGAFFELADQHPSVDLLASYLRPAEPDWWWYRTAMSRHAVPHRCLFSLVRISRRAGNLLLSKRVEHSAQLRRVALWPNDEAFVATTLAAAHACSKDFNDLGAELYNEETFSYHSLVDGRKLDLSEPRPTLYHPVLTGERFEKKRERLAREAVPSTLSERFQRKYVPLLSRRTPW